MFYLNLVTKVALIFMLAFYFLLCLIFILQYISRKPTVDSLLTTYVHKRLFKTDVTEAGGVGYPKLVRKVT